MVSLLLKTSGCISFRQSIFRDSVFRLLEFYASWNTNLCENRLVNVYSLSVKLKKLEHNLNPDSDTSLNN